MLQRTFSVHCLVSMRSCCAVVLFSRSTRKEPESKKVGIAADINYIPSLFHRPSHHPGFGDFQVYSNDVT